MTAEPTVSVPMTERRIRVSRQQRDALAEAAAFPTIRSGSAADQLVALWDAATDDVLAESDRALQALREIAALGHGAARYRAIDIARTALEEIHAAVARTAESERTVRWCETHGRAVGAVHHVGDCRTTTREVGDVVGGGA